MHAPSHRTRGKATSRGTLCSRPERENLQTLRHEPDSILHLCRRLPKLRKDIRAPTLGSWQDFDAAPRWLGTRGSRNSERGQSSSPGRHPTYSGHLAAALCAVSSLGAVQICRATNPRRSRLRSWRSRGDPPIMPGQERYLVVVHCRHDGSERPERGNAPTVQHVRESTRLRRWPLPPCQAIGEWRLTARVSLGWPT